jgi:hypothetical protein
MKLHAIDGIPTNNKYVGPNINDWIVCPYSCTKSIRENSSSE